MSEDQGDQTEENNAKTILTKSCRLCAQQSDTIINIFSEEGRAKCLPDKVSRCLPVLINEHDDLPTTICGNCCEKVEHVRAFFESCFNANQALIILLRKVQTSPLDLETQINQYVRTFSAPIVPHIKIEPSQLCDVDFSVPGEYENNEKSDIKPLFDESNDSWIDDDDEDDDEEEEEEEEEEEDDDENGGEEDDGFKIPEVPRKRKRRGRPKKSSDPYFDLDPEFRFVKKHSRHSKRGRKRLVPLSMKTCSACGEEFADHATNLAHWKEKHPDQEVSYRCTNKECKFETKSSDDIFKHRLKHRLKGRMRDGGRMEACKICGKNYPPSYLYTSHMLVHTDSKEHKCSVCEKRFKTNGSLRTHLKLHGPAEIKFPYCCDICGRRFSQRANLELHTRVHTGEKPCTCDYCGKAFSQKGNMEEHRRTHTGEKPYVCELCGSSYVRRGELVLHNRIAHTGERPFQCAYCPKSFQRRDLLRKHERIHTNTRPYACEYCAKTFTARDKLVVHTRLHTGERPYVCEVCGKGFCESGNMKKHMRVHGKDAPPILHQNNKGKPAPNPTNYTVAKVEPNHESQHSLEEAAAPPPDPLRSQTPASVLQVPLAPKQEPLPPPTTQQQQQQPYPAFPQHLHLHPQQRSVSNDDQSDTASERSVTPSTYIPAPAHHPLHQSTPLSLAAASPAHYAMHGLMQHLQDWSAVYGHHSTTSGTQHHNNH